MRRVVASAGLIKVIKVIRLVGLEKKSKIKSNIDFPDKFRVGSQGHVINWNLRS